MRKLEDQHFVLTRCGYWTAYLLLFADDVGGYEACDLFRRKLDLRLELLVSIGSDQKAEQPSPILMRSQAAVGRRLFSELYKHVRKVPVSENSVFGLFLKLAVSWTSASRNDLTRASKEERDP
jgi:hypothetical protein